MIPGYPQAQSVSDEIALLLPNSGGDIAIDKWISYRFDSDFLTPTDTWQFETAGTDINPQILDNLYVGAKVLFQINGHTQGGGYIDSVDWHHSPESGTTYIISGRDSFGPICDANADPLLYSFTSEQLLSDVVQKLFNQFGFSDPSQFIISNDANRTVQTGVKLTTTKGRDLSAVKVAQQLQPYPDEGCFQYLTRFLHRFGIWCWPSADQSQVILSTPQFDSTPIFTITRLKDGSASNVLSGGVRCDATDQPSCILATGSTFGNITARAGMKVLIVNEFTGIVSSLVESTGTLAALENATVSANDLVSPNINALIGRYPEAFKLAPRPEFLQVLGAFCRTDPIARPMFLHDDEAKTLDQLVAFCYKEMSLRQQRMWTANYTVTGHTQGPTHAPWAVDSMVTVNDEMGFGMNAPMYLRGRTFEKSRNGGTVTHLRLILPYTLDFGAGNGSVALIQAAEAAESNAITQNAANNLFFTTNNPGTGPAF